MSINVPTTETGKRMLRSVSPIYDRAYTARWIFEVMGIEVEEACKFIDEFRLQAFPETATWGLCYWEQRYHIRTDESLTLEERRQKIVARRWKNYPLIPARIERFVQDYCGCDTRVVEHNSEYKIEVIIDGEGNMFDYYQMYSLLRKKKPSHIQLELNIIYGSAIAREHTATKIYSSSINSGAVAERF